MHIDLNIFITNLETNLQKKSVGIHEFNGSYSTASAEHYKQKVFSDGDFLHANTKYADQCISCNTIKPKNIILGFCDKFHQYNIPDEELYDRPNYPLIYFSVYTYQAICEKHGIIQMDQLYSKYVKQMMI